MSAFIVSTKHAMVIATEYNRMVLGVKSPTFTDSLPIAKILMAANVKSVNCRYGTHTRMAKFVETSHCSKPPTNMQLMKLINCIDYQSCEFSAWSTSKARRMLDELSVAILNKLTQNIEYEYAEWCI